MEKPWLPADFPSQARVAEAPEGPIVTGRGSTGECRHTLMQEGS